MGAQMGQAKKLLEQVKLGVSPSYGLEEFESGCMFHGVIKPEGT
jgi:hypothetical protein